MRSLNRQARLCVTQPLSKSVDSNDDTFFTQTGWRKLWWRQFRYSIFFKISGQSKFQQNKILPHWKRGLWLYEGIPQIGDALMDLAPRSIFPQNSITIDLWTEKHIALMFYKDQWFSKVFHFDEKINVKNYDFVLISSNKRRSLLKKINSLKKVPWISMNGFYTGPEFHRGNFATQRIADVFSIELSCADFDAYARQKLSSLNLPLKRKDSAIKIAFSMGGVDPLRTYNQWIAVARQLNLHVDLEITLIGSINAVESAKEFEHKWTGIVHNAVNQTSVLKCRQIINNQDMLIACDSGLMHLGITTHVKLISLFTSTVNPCWRLPTDKYPTAIQSKTENVNSITPNEIVFYITENLKA